MTAEAGAGVEGLETEGLAAGGGDDLPDVDAHGGEDDFHFVDQGDVDGAVDVFQQLGGFGDLGGGDGDDFVDGLLVEGDGDFAGDFVDSADEFWDGLGAGIFSAGVFAFGGEGEEEVCAAEQAAGLEQGENDLAGGAGVGGGFENDQLSGTEAEGDFFGAFADEGEVGLAVVAEGGGDADEDRIGLRKAGKIGGGVESSGGFHVGDEGFAEVFEVIFAAVEGFGLGGVVVESDHVETGAVEGGEEGEADVAEADDADAGGFGVDFVEEFHGVGIMYRKGGPGCTSGASG